MRVRFPSRIRWAWLLLLLPVTTAFGAWIIDGSRFPDGAAPVEKTFPVLVLELGGAWTDFELKASVDNFESLVYFVKSSELILEGDPDVWIYFSDDHYADPRVWRKAEVGTPIGEQLADPVNSEVRYVMVSPSHSTPVDWSTWMKEKNEKLVWSYVRYDGLSLEMNVTETTSKWNLVVPVQWRENRVAP